MQESYAIAVLQRRQLKYSECPYNVVENWCKKRQYSKEWVYQALLHWMDRIMYRKWNIKEEKWEAVKVGRGVIHLQVSCTGGWGGGDEQALRIERKAVRCEDKKWTNWMRGWQALWHSCFCSDPSVALCYTLCHILLVGLVWFDKDTMVLFFLVLCAMQQD